jgi:hypothetical protein
MKATGIIAVFLLWSCMDGLPSTAQTSQPSEDEPADQSTPGIQESAGTHRPLPYEFGWQATLIRQRLLPFHSPYAGQRGGKRQVSSTGDPEPGWLSTVKSAPMGPARSCIPVSPKSSFESGVAIVKPRPSSVTHSHSSASAKLNATPTSLAWACRSAFVSASCPIHDLRTHGLEV